MTVMLTLSLAMNFAFMMSKDVILVGSHNVKCMDTWIETGDPMAV